MKILLIEDDPNTCTLIVQALEAEGGIICDVTESGEDGLSFFNSSEYHLIILDMLLPDINGFDLLTRLRRSKHKTPILVISGVDDTQKKIEMLGQGADDYMTKPFEIKELVARIKAIIRRTGGHAENTMQIGDLIIDLNTHTSSIKNINVDLTAKEQEMLELLALRKGSVISKESFINQLYNGLDEPDFKIIDVFVCKMRKKLKNASGGKDYINTIWGRGYVLKEPDKKKVAAFKNTAFLETENLAEVE